MSIKAGDRIRDNVFHKQNGTVTHVIPGHSVEDHGFIMVDIDPGKSAVHGYHEEVFEESYSYYGWEKVLTLKKAEDK